MCTISQVNQVNIVEECLTSFTVSGSISLSRNLLGVRSNELSIGIFCLLVYLADTGQITWYPRRLVMFKATRTYCYKIQDARKVATLRSSSI